MENYRITFVTEDAAAGKGCLSHASTQQKINKTNAFIHKPLAGWCLLSFVGVEGQHMSERRRVPTPEALATATPQQQNLTT